MASKKLDIRTFDLVDNGREWILFGKTEEWRIQVWNNKYEFSQSNLRTCTLNDDERPFGSQQCTFIGAAARHIDEIVWGYSPEFFRPGCDKPYELSRVLNLALPMGINMPPELWNKVRTWIRRNYDWSN